LACSIAVAQEADKVFLFENFLLLLYEDLVNLSRISPSNGENFSSKWEE